MGALVSVFVAVLSCLITPIIADEYLRYWFLGLVMLVSSTLSRMCRFSLVLISFCLLRRLGRYSAVHLVGPLVVRAAGLCNLLPVDVLSVLPTASGLHGAVLVQVCRCDVSMVLLLLSPGTTLSPKRPPLGSCRQ